MRLKWLDKSKHKRVYNLDHNKLILKIPIKIVLIKENILLGIFRRRQKFNEIRTIRSVENCRWLVFEEIERFFEQKERAIKSLLPALITGRKSYSNIFDKNDSEKIYTETEKIILNELLERFNSAIIWHVKKINLDDDWVSDIFSPILQYQKTKKRTVLIASYIETLSRRALSDSIEALIMNSLLAKIVCNIDISKILLPKLSINSTLETMELNKELINRIGGAFYSIKFGLVQEINKQIANVFYETHDLLLNSTIDHKIHLLEEKITREEIYEPNLLQA